MSRPTIYGVSRPVQISLPDSVVATMDPRAMFMALYEAMVMEGLRLFIGTGFDVVVTQRFENVNTRLSLQFRPVPSGYTPGRFERVYRIAEEGPFWQGAPGLRGTTPTPEEQHISTWRATESGAADSLVWFTPEEPSQPTPLQYPEES